MRKGRKDGERSKGNEGEKKGSEGTGVRTAKRENVTSDTLEIVTNKKG